MVATDLGALSGFVLWLRHEATRSAPADFRKSALKHLNTHIPFDRAIWAAATVTSGMALGTPELYNIPGSQRSAFEAAAHADPRLPTVLSQAGTAFAYSVQGDDPSDYRAIVDAIDVHNVLSITHFDPILGTANGMTLVSGRGRQSFTDAHRDFVEAAFPHLRHAWTDCQVEDLAQRAGTNQRARRAAAIAQGLAFTAADDEFVRLLRMEWPEWQGPHVPDELVVPNSRTMQTAYTGKWIVIQTAMAVDTVVVSVRKRAAADELTDREMTVAVFCAQGLTHKEIASRLGITTATARNHIAAVHRRLNVTRNIEIGQLLPQFVDFAASKDPGR